MENLEQYWEQCFSPFGHKFAELRPNYQEMEEADSVISVAADVLHPLRRSIRIFRFDNNI